MYQSNCPICGSIINFQNLPEENELLTCENCNNKLVAKNIIGNNIILEEAPTIEEDWGE
ncbi:MAG: hypothetical protein KatS3mg095_0285 [Candidatus Parcubacteria bacterium]|nr:MAG: hypothetical protein KatS3mg095_0285 [Candidatus Parcubacteria bacterium]